MLLIALLASERLVETASMSAIGEHNRVDTAKKRALLLLLVNGCLRRNTFQLRMS